ncbi:subtilisin family serine protease [Streptosporangium becharense]|uniref:Subtilisin family serine protease n=1 Tax=Streptosporangium becharense TaxID=1816182 RepID=A0A7W9MI76_9ACTN|nr:S8 family serine peptidase [Streptosporangium becharense]MBB2913543.1 subtilisin family serine protease [Streptosporangium becharense]MBB5821233.1 subtilisin family serine protease [Streptosporangium becharense]
MLRRWPWAAAALAASLLTASPAVAAPAGAAAGREAGVRPVPGAAADVREDQRWVLEMLNVEQAWRTSKGAGVTVALVDSGVDADVAELRGRVVTGPDMGSITFDPGRPGAGRHGTAMASLIAGAGDGEGGLLGTAPGATILSLPLIVADEPEDGSALPEEDLRSRADSPLARAIRYATDHGAKVVSMSLGAYGPHRSEREAVSYALSKGVVLVAAVGNDGDTPYALENATSFWNFPAGYSGVIGVAAVDARGKPAAFSSDNLSVQVSAPGVDVPVVLPGGEYGSSEGTSSATALVAGIVALIKAKYPDISPHTVSRALTSTARFTPAAGYDDHVGFGVVDAAAALARAGELVARAREVPVPEGEHFGGGIVSEGPRRPGADPVRLWLYGTGLLAGVLAFTGGLVVLGRRSGRPRPGTPEPGRGPDRDGSRDSTSIRTRFG